MSTTTDLVQKLPPAITGSIIHYLRKDGGNAGQLLQVSHVWRAAFMKAMCNRIEILQLWREGRFDCKYTVGKENVDAFSSTNHELVKQAKLEFELHSVLLGYALESLNREPFNAFKFPSVYMVDISIIICPCSQEIDTEKARKNISEFAAFVKQMCPGIDSKRVYVSKLSSDVDANVLDLSDTLIAELYSKATLRHKSEFTQKARQVPSRVRTPSPDKVKPFSLTPAVPKKGFEVVEYDKEKGAFLVVFNPYVRCPCCREYCYMKKQPNGKYTRLPGADGKKFTGKGTRSLLCCSKSKS